MSKKGLRELPRNLSPTMLALNPHLANGLAPAIATLKEASQAVSKAPELKKPRGRKGMNKTETAYSLILEAKLRRGELDRWDREGLTLRWPDGMTYTPDFVAYRKYESGLEYPLETTLIETKGAWIEGDALVKFRSARAHWPMFHFELWQYAGGVWTQLL